MRIKKTVIAAMSGGVDSSVAALLLKNKGYEVTGVTLRLLDCAGGQEAGRAAETIGIRHYVLDFREIFEKEVIAPFCEYYLAGETPNPCVECNTKIKFGALLEKTREFGADFMATGHYARIEESGGKLFLKKGADPKKDQSYFLYTMTQARLGKTLMPLGGLTKEEIRRMAREAGLPSAGRAESQEICFIEDDDYRRFLSGRFPGRIKPGRIIDKDGIVIGTHGGAAFFTVGQRRGLNLNAGKPCFVAGIRGNTVIAGESGDVYSRKCEVRGVNLITGELPPGGRAAVKIRHPGQPRPAKITMLPGDRARVEFDEPKWAPAPGQSAVFYEGETVLGGGIIAKEEGKDGG